MSFYTYYEQKHFCDIILDVTGDGKSKQFHCHRLFLSSVSEVFHVMFTGPFAESGQSVIKIQNTDPDLFEQFLTTLYLGSFNHLDSSHSTESWNDSVVESRLVIAQLCDFYQVKLDTIAFPFSYIKINSDNMIDHLLTLSLIRHKVDDKTISKCAKLIDSNTRLYKLPTDLIIRLLDDKYYRPKNEQDTLDLVAKCVENGHDQSLYSHVKFGSFPHKSIPQLIDRCNIPKDLVFPKEKNEGISKKCDNVRRSVVMKIISYFINNELKSNKEIVIYLTYIAKVYNNSVTIKYIKAYSLDCSCNNTEFHIYGSQDELEQLFDGIYSLVRIKEYVPVYYKNSNIDHVNVSTWELY